MGHIRNPSSSLKRRTSPASWRPDIIRVKCAVTVAEVGVRSLTVNDTSNDESAGASKVTASPMPTVFTYALPSLTKGLT